MTATALNAADYLLITIFGLCIFLGFMRGFFKEIMSLLVWGASIVVSSLYSSRMAASISGNALAEGVSSSASLFAIAGSFAGLFIGTWLAGTFFTYLLTSATRPAGASMPNRMAGALFGFAKGYIFAVIFIFIAELTPMGNQPIWQQSQVVGVLRPTVAWLGTIVNPQIELLKAKASEAAQGFGTKMQEQIQQQSDQKAAGILQGAMPATPEPTAP